MNNIRFCKYHGTGNDFIILDGRNNHFEKMWTKDDIANLCHRRFGIGADGLIILKNSDKADFEMIYYNADGGQSSMCGNGGRCIVAFAHSLGIFQTKTSFVAIDGMHLAKIEGSIIHLKMNNVDTWSMDDEDYVLNTGSPHYVQFVDEISEINVDQQGAFIRYNETYKQEGINVNFVKEYDKHIAVATYERGVEAQTYSCGTGVVASCIAHSIKHNFQSIDCHVHTKGGALKVTADRSSLGYENVWLIGPATMVFKGSF